MTVSFYGYVWNAEKEVWAFPEGFMQRLRREEPKADEQSYEDYMAAEPVLNPNYDRRFDVNISNFNAKDVLGALGMELDDPVMPVEQFINRVAAARRSRLNKQSPARKGFITRQHRSEGATMLHLGRDAGYVEAILERLSVLAQAVKEVGATHIGWG
jgi:hypothetical protein